MTLHGPRIPLALVLIAPSILALLGSSSRAAAPTEAELRADWLRQAELRGRGLRDATPVTPEVDAAGACDGVKDGKWGFHTADEDDPWWQVDLGQPTPLDQIQVYNRCDEYAARASRLAVLLSDDGKAWRQAYRHDGTAFFGHHGGPPLSVPLHGATARWVRLQLPGKTYFHLDEVEIYRSGALYETNVARGRPATQSSTSPWSAASPVAGVTTSDEFTAGVLRGGLRLAEVLRSEGITVDVEMQQLRQIEQRLKGLAADNSGAKEEAYLAARRAIRRMAFTNPLLDFDTILFVKRAPGALPHMSDQYYGWWSRPGGGLCLLEGFRGEQPRVRCLTEAMPPGSFLRPDLSCDGRKILFAYCRYHPDVMKSPKTDKEKLPEDAFYHLFEINIDGTGSRQLTHGRYDDFDGRYLPNGRIVFLSTRKGQFLRVGKASAAATCRGTEPDSFVRCGGDDHRPCAVYTLHSMDADGGNPRAISAFENFEWTPSVARDGRILYARWDYIDRHNGPYMSLWSTNPDGTNPALVYGNFTVQPHCIFEARPVPNSHKLVFTASSHHSITGGSLALLDRTRGGEGAGPLERLTPEVCFPEAEGSPPCYYASPFPLSEDFFLVAWSDHPLPPHWGGKPVLSEQNPADAMGLYLYDRFGNLELIHRDAELGCECPIPVRPRPRPPVLASTIHDEAGGEGEPLEGRLLVQDVREGLPPRWGAEVKRLRILAALPKTQPHMNTPPLGVLREDIGKFVLGTVPVAEDGSAYFRVPSGMPLFFQALDARGRAVQTMRTLTYVQPGETLSCVGCHESRDRTPSAARLPLAASGPASKIAPGPEGSWPLDFAALVQPVLDKHCVSCHRPGADGDAFDLSAGKAYDSWLAQGSGALREQVLTPYRQGYSTAGMTPSLGSPVLALLDAGHHEINLDADDYDRLVTWLDTGGLRQGSFSPEQEQSLRKLRDELWPLLERP